MTLRLIHFECGCALEYKHDVVLSLASTFILLPDYIKLTRHRLNNPTQGKTFIKIDKNTKFFCQQCGVEVTFKLAAIRCDDCSKPVLLSDVVKVGNQLKFCKTCAKRSNKYSFLSEFLPKMSEKDIETMSKDAGYPAENFEIRVGRQPPAYAGDPFWLRNDAGPQPVEEEIEEEFDEEEE